MCFNYRIKPILGWFPPEVDPETRIQGQVQGEWGSRTKGKTVSYYHEQLGFSPAENFRDSIKHVPK
jgi:hypothetical protein